jgi:phospholipase C
MRIEGNHHRRGNPRTSFRLSKQFKGVLKAPSKFSLVPTSKTPYTTLPPPNTDGTPSVASDSNPAPFTTLKAATLFEGQSLPVVDLPLLTSGASGLLNHVIDTRILNVNNLPSGPFQLTPGVSYDDYSGSPVHRFYQMFQQLDCAAAQATPENPSGCLADLFPWVEVSIGAGNNGKPQPTGFNDETTGEGAILQCPARRRALFHQARQHIRAKRQLP